MRDAADFSENTLIHAVADLLLAIDHDLFIDKLIYILRMAISFDDYVVLVYHPVEKPVVLGSSLASDELVAWERYLEGAYLLSPFYDFCMQGGEGLVSLDEIAPDDFYQSAYHDEYFRFSGLVDEVCFVIQSDHDLCYLISLGRTQTLSKFNHRVLNKCRAYYPLIRSAVLMHDRQNAPVSRGSHEPIKTALLNFGEGSLTPREKEVMQLLIRGHSSKESARKLDMSYETERVHRKNIYVKLGVNSQKELLGKLFDQILNPNH
ncbi:helix-turn-helix transcriptional regulator [Celerinatantimonas sp. YJH-8]|uniref:helix-turn-helix domain-containing protein n=1 Tax=Celerinatantimonas sp. YJH-8 TaxID=3228714 RepID=UPI0038C0CF76